LAIGVPAGHVLRTQGRKKEMSGAGKWAGKAERKTECLFSPRAGLTSMLVGSRNFRQRGRRDRQGDIQKEGPKGFVNEKDLSVHDLPSFPGRFVGLVGCS